MIYGSVDDSISDLKTVVAKTGVPDFSIDYTLAPAAGAPAQVIEGYADLKYMIEKKEFGLDQKRIRVMGESAGLGFSGLLDTLDNDTSAFLRGLCP